MRVKILVADDEPQLIAAYQDCFATGTESDSELAELGAALFDDDDANTDEPDFSNFQFDYVSQGEDAIRAVREAVEAGEPYSMLFLDMRMPPGIDGKETAMRVREIDPSVNIVIVTGYSDHSPFAIAKVAGPLDKLFYVAKPFNTAEIQQLALALSKKWSVEHSLKAARAQLTLQVEQLEEVNVRIAASEAHALYLALHDQLTKLPNRLNFTNLTKAMLDDRDAYVAIIFLDLDHFKNVNDALGHSAGDELICLLAERMRKGLPKGTLIGRFGGDEFALAVTEGGHEQAIATAEKALEITSSEFEIMGTSVFIGASAGIADNACGSISLTELLRRADLALYSAKDDGRGVVRWFNQDLDESTQLRLQTESRLRLALAEDQLQLKYQPIILPETGEPIGYEALLRWQDDELGDVPPTLFVPIAEQCGMARALGEWVMRRAIADAATWETGMVSINISTHHFQSNDLIGFVRAQAEKHNFPLSRIQIEITESAMFADPKMAAQIIRDLRAAGIRVALDDFGTGYSSLVNLRDFEIDCIKIDKSFVDSVGTEKQTSAIINSVAALARMLGLKVVAEGVETIEQVQYLQALGCGLMQGFYYSEALEHDELPFPQLTATERENEDVIDKAKRA